MIPKTCRDCSEEGHEAGAMCCPCPQDVLEDQLDNPTPPWAGEFS